MSSRRGRTTQRQRTLSWGLLSLVVVYFLSLCTLSPLVHAALLQQAVRAQRTAVMHCAIPASAPDSTGHSAPERDQTPVPVCCDLVRIHKTTSASCAQDIALLLQGLTSLPLDFDACGWAAEGIYLVHPPHASLSPPLYLRHAVLLI